MEYRYNSWIGVGLSSLIIMMMILTENQDGWLLSPLWLIIKTLMVLLSMILVVSALMPPKQTTERVGVAIVESLLSITSIIVAICYWKLMSSTENTTKTCIKMPSNYWDYGWIEGTKGILKGYGHCIQPEPILIVGVSSWLVLLTISTMLWIMVIPWLSDPYVAPIPKIRIEPRLS